MHSKVILGGIIGEIVSYIIREFKNFHSIKILDMFLINLERFPKEISGGVPGGIRGETMLQVQSKLIAFPNLNFYENFSNTPCVPIISKPGKLPRANITSSSSQ